MEARRLQRMISKHEREHMRSLYAESYLTQEVVFSPLPAVVSRGSYRPIHSLRCNSNYWPWLLGNTHKLQIVCYFFDIRQTLIKNWSSPFFPQTDGQTEKYTLSILENLEKRGTKKDIYFTPASLSAAIHRQGNLILYSSNSPPISDSCV